MVLTAPLISSYQQQVFTNHLDVRETVNLHPVKERTSPHILWAAQNQLLRPVDNFTLADLA